tara:strand:+ start:346 stop:615 length:270 start_codon:yes stop_codon:yes gene_type:complete
MKPDETQIWKDRRSKKRDFGKSHGCNWRLIKILFKINLVGYVIILVLEQTGLLPTGYTGGTGSMNGTFLFCFMVFLYWLLRNKVDRYLF